MASFMAKILSWRFRQLNIVGCLLKRRPTKGGHGHPKTPPSHAPVFFGVGEAHHWWLLFQVAATWPIWRIMQIEQGIIHWGFR